MKDKKIIIELTPEEVKMLAYGAMPSDLKERFLKISYHLDGKEKKEKVLTLEDQPDLRNKLKTKKITLEEIKKTKPKAYDPWSNEEDKNLKRVFLKGCRINDIAKQLQRSSGAIRCRLFKLGLIDEDTI